jgi:hypothetical protein
MELVLVEERVMPMHSAAVAIYRYTLSSPDSYKLMQEPVLALL